jgi:GrpB-like predicted nucleotidyltransferase (UPF0157 family)
MKFLPPHRYQPMARKLFRDLSRRMSAVLPGARIEHVGSSAVQGLWSKGDLDVFVGVPPATFADTIETLASLGFREKTDTLRTNELCQLVVEGYPIPVAIQVVALGSRFEFFLGFCDVLTRNHKLRDDYNRLKRSSAVLDEQEYRERKSQFVEAVLRDCASS